MEILFFFAPWCKKCPEQLTLLREVVAGKFPVKEVNIEEDTKHRINYTVRTIPAVVVINSEDDSLVDRVQGVMERFQMENLMQSITEGGE